MFAVFASSWGFSGTVVAARFFGFTWSRSFRIGWKAFGFGFGFRGGFFGKEAVARFSGFGFGFREAANRGSGRRLEFGSVVAVSEVSSGFFSFFSEVCFLSIFCAVMIFWRSVIR